ncbi:MAG: S-adenosyl-l-methionine hydroxide adenosyltransferase family protein [Aquificaceae bacterium]
MNSVIAILTDFGARDGFVGAMKGVILGINPYVNTVDISHEVEPFNIMHGALILRSHFFYFPKGTIFLCVVDPGVGSERLPVIVKAGDYLFVGPYNGLFDLALRNIDKDPRAYKIEKYILPDISQTFHGRDIFAPAAAYLSRGVKPHKFGSPVEYRLTLPWEEARREGEYLVGKIVYFDRFGNCITNIPCSPCLEGVFRGKRLRIATHYLEVEKGEPALICGSFGLMELFIPMDNAKERLKVERGEEIRVKVV